ncbi:BUD32 protein kinase [Pelomyxa schiedti]|nr:BUD32 protein kinase [Pelomyxa schiedti]
MASTSTVDATNLVNQGAEARVYRIRQDEKNVIVKERFSKKYRHPTLDALLTRKRINSEAKCMARAKGAGVDTPTIFRVDKHTSRLYMEDIGTLSVKLFLWANCSTPNPLARATAATSSSVCSTGNTTSSAAVTPNNSAATNSNATYSPDCLRICQDIGRAIAFMHTVDVVHGDLTTSNFLLRTPENTIVAIDFGLSYVSSLIEDKAVDLYVLERAFLCTHPSSGPLFSQVLETYASQYKQGPAVLQRLEQVRLRGRKKLAFG